MAGAPRSDGSPDEIPSRSFQPTGRSGMLPVPLTPLVGREDEVAAAGVRRPRPLPRPSPLLDSSRRPAQRGVSLPQGRSVHRFSSPT